MIEILYIAFSISVWAAFYYLCYLSSIGTDFGSSGLERAGLLFADTDFFFVHFFCGFYGLYAHGLSFSHDIRQVWGNSVYQDIGRRDKTLYTQCFWNLSSTL